MDIDGDGVPNHLDLDSDTEFMMLLAGFQAIDTNLDGMLDFNDSAFADDFFNS